MQISPDYVLNHFFCVFSIWTAFGGNKHDLGSFGEATDKITDLHEISWKKSIQRLDFMRRCLGDIMTASEYLWSGSVRQKKP